jgi:hypothetical protein
MAAEQLKKIGLYIGGVSLIITVLGSVVGMAWKGSSALTSYDLTIQNNEKVARSGIDAVAENQAEDRASVKELAGIVSLLKKETREEYIKFREEHAKDVKELRQDISDSKVRDERMSTQYTAILSHMTQQTASDKRQESSIGNIQVDIGKLQTQYDTLTKD